jgi:hypothetical protein
MTFRKRSAVQLFENAGIRIGKSLSVRDTRNRLCVIRCDSDVILNV